MDQFQIVTGIISKLFSNHSLKILPLIDNAEFTCRSITIDIIRIRVSQMTNSKVIIDPSPLPKLVPIGFFLY